jgi:hypothetical protein
MVKTIDRRSFRKADSSAFMSADEGGNSKKDQNPYCIIKLRVRKAPCGKIISYRSEDFSGGKRHLKILKGSNNPIVQEAIGDEALCLVKKVDQKHDTNVKIEYFILVQVIDERQVSDLLFSWDKKSNSWTSYQRFDRCNILFQANRKQDEEKLPKPGCDAHVIWDIKPMKVFYGDSGKRFYIIGAELVKEKTSSNAVQQQKDKGLRNSVVEESVS